MKSALDGGGGTPKADTSTDKLHMYGGRGCKKSIRIFYEWYIQGQTKQLVLRSSCIDFHLLTFQLVVIPRGKRDLSSLPDAGEAAVQISSKKEAVGLLM